MKIFRIIPVSFYLSAFLLLLGFIIFAYNSHTALHQRTIQKFEREAMLLTNLVEKKIHERYHDAELSSLMLGPMTKESFPTIVASNNTKRGLESLVNSHYFYRKIAILDLSGNVLIDSGSLYSSAEVLDRESISNMAWFRSLSNNVNSNLKKIFIFGPKQQFIDKSSLQFDILMASVLTSSDGEKLGYWLNIIDFKVVEEVFKEIHDQLSNKQLDHANLSLLDKDGTLLIDFDPIGKKKANYNRDFSILTKKNLVEEGIPGTDRAIAGFTGSVISDSIIGTPKQLIVYNHFKGIDDLSNLGWSTIIRIDCDDAFSDSSFLIVNITLLGLFLIIILALTYRSIILKHILPLYEIYNTIQDLNKGKLNYKKINTIHGEIAIDLTEINEQLIKFKTLENISKEQLELLELQRSVINSTATGMVVTDIRLPDEPIIFINKAFTAITGYKAEEVLGKSCTFLHGELTEKSKVERISKAVIAGETCSIDLINYRKSGETFINSLTIDPVFNKNNVLTHYISTQQDITEAKKREQQTIDDMTHVIEKRTKESQESSNRLRAIFNTSLDGTIVLDNNGIIIDVNKALELIFGRSKSELINQHIAIILLVFQFNTDDLATPFKEWLKTFVGKPEKLFGIHKSGNHIPIEISIGETTINDKLLYVGAIRDITFQQQTKQREIELQNQLYEQELIYRTAFNQAAVGIARVGIDSYFVEVNRKMCEILGYHEDELCKLQIKDITFDTEKKQADNYIKRLLDDEISYFNTDKRYIRKDKSVFWANLSVSLVRDTITNSPKFFIAVVEDISERKDFEQALFDINKEREKLLAGLNIASEAGGVSNWAFDIITKELHWDVAMRRLYGMNLESALVYDDWKATVHTDDIEDIEADVFSAIKNTCSFKSEFRIFNKITKDMHWIQCAANVSCDEDNNPIVMYGINIDITQSKLIQIELEKESKAAKHASEAKSRFLATMSHEIRTPMNGVIGMIDLLRETPLSADQKRMTATIKDSSFSLLDIINDILDFSKIESGQVVLELTPSNVLSIIEKTIDTLWINASNKGIQLIIHPDLSIPQSIYVDTVRVRQIILNLLGNAIKFTGDEKSGVVIVKFSFDKVESTLVIEVIDNGLGISDSQQSKLFKPFMQADSSTTRKFGGTGLGLSISKSFTDLMNGEITVSSELGKGSCFRLSLPITTIDDYSGEFESLTFRSFKVIIALRAAELANCCEYIIKQLDVDSVKVVSIESLQNLYQQACSKTIIITCSHEYSTIVNETLVKTLMLDLDPIKPKGHVDPISYVVGAYPLKTTEFIHGIAVLCGLESPLLNWSEPGEFSQPKKIMTISEAEENNCLILVAEDQPTNRLVLGKQLENLGYTCEMAVDGIEALALWKSGRFSLLLTDCHMPNMDGLELTKQIRLMENETHASAITIVAVTANALAGESENCINAGMNDYLPKPVDISILKQLLNKYLPIDSLNETIISNDLQLNEQANTSSIDFDHLKIVIGTDDIEITNEILLMYWNSVNDDVEKIENAITSKSLDVIKSRAHASKGASVSSGAMQIGELFKWIEDNFSNIDGVSSHLQLVEQELKNIKLALIHRGVL